jgi:hypothetical protein
MGDASSAPAEGRVAQWIEDQVKGVDVSGMRQDEAAAKQAFWRESLSSKADVIGQLLGQHRRLHAWVSPDGTFVLIGKPHNAAAEFRRFQNAVVAKNADGAAAALTYSLAFTAYPPLAEAERFYEEWPYAANEVASIANDLCGASGQRLGKS